MFTPKKTLALGLVGVVALAGCAGSDYGPGGRYQNTGAGAGLGAAAGAAAGTLFTGGSSTAKNAAIGAVVGAGLGAAIGSDLDRQAAELRGEFRNGQIQVINTGTELVVRMPQDILFDYDSAALRPELQGDLRVLAQHLNKYANSNVIVEGHTDSDGSASYNQQLSQQRAQTVVGILTGNGVSRGRLVAVGKGESEPVADNLTAAGKQQNRRVEIIIQPTR
jgi:outer membrane protein OmpA-like peptidoglycan-associated protein